MKSPHYFIVRPHQGVRYNASKNLNGKDFIMSSSQEDHRYTNRIGVVVATPIGYSGEIAKGDLVVVHHNVFKYYNDIHGNERSGRSYLFDNIFFIDDDQFFLYKRENEWKAHSRYCFVLPEKRMDNYILSKIGNEEYLRGTLIYPNQELIDKELNRHRKPPASVSQS